MEETAQSCESSVQFSWTEVEVQVDATRYRRTCDSVEMPITIPGVQTARFVTWRIDHPPNDGLVGCRISLAILAHEALSIRW